RGPALVIADRRRAVRRGAGLAHRARLSAGDRLAPAAPRAGLGGLRSAGFQPACRRDAGGPFGGEKMRFGLFGSAQARRPTPGTELTDSSQGFREWIENNVEAEALGFHSTFVVEHHFTGFGQVSASLNLLTWLGARTSTLRLGTAVLVLPWHNPVLLAE